MRRSYLLLAVAGALAVVVPPAQAGGGAPAPVPPAQGGDPAGPGGGAKYDHDAKPPAKQAPARKPAAKDTPARQKKSARRGPAAAPPVPTPTRPAEPGHLFPVAGPFAFGGKGSRFGAGRSGHAHQGQDIAAAQGTPVVAPRTGVIEVVRYQAAGAGHYVVLDGAGEDRDYVFMHLVTGSVSVYEAQPVKKGTLLGQVGNTGVSFGPHLHFEIWIGGGWYTGGHPINPLPLLRRWSR